MNEKKYEIVKDQLKIYGMKTLYRIRALKDFSDVKKGYIGGYVEGTWNLSQQGDCWIYDDAYVFGDSIISSNAKIYDDARIYGDAIVCGNSRVSEKAFVYGHAIIVGDSIVGGNTSTHDNAIVCNNAQILGDVSLHGHSVVGCDAYITSNHDYLSIKGFGSKNGITTFFRCSDGTIKVACKRFRGTIKEFIKIINHDSDKYEKEYLSLLDSVKTYFNIKDDN